MDLPQPSAGAFRAPAAPSAPPRPSALPAAVFPAAAPTPSAAGVKRKRQGNHVVHGAVPAAALSSSAAAVLPPIVVAGSRTAASSTPSGGRLKSQAKGPRKKAAAAQGRLPPPPPPADHVPRDPVSTGAHNLFDQTPESYNGHTSYADLLEENEVDLSAPLDAFDSGMHPKVEAKVDERDDGYDEVEELEEEEFNASQAKFEKRTGNYTETEDVCLIRA